jgi:hypothetical protein
MSDELQLIATGKLTHIRVAGKLTKEDYEKLAPVINQQIKAYGKLRILFEMHDFHGWTAGALWEDIKFDFQHWKDIERLAIVGENKWEQSMALFCKPFTLAKIQYFDHHALYEAEAWLLEE